MIVYLLVCFLNLLLTFYIYTYDEWNGKFKEEKEIKELELNGNEIIVCFIPFLNIAYSLFLLVIYFCMKDIEKQESEKRNIIYFEED